MKTMFATLLRFIRYTILHLHTTLNVFSSTILTDGNGTIEPISVRCVCVCLIAKFSLSVYDSPNEKAFYMHLPFAFI